MHCGMCLPTCPTYDETKRERSSPRGRIRLMREVADGRLDVTATFADEMSYCLGCLACQTACPAGVDYATLLENARGESNAAAWSASRRRFVRAHTVGDVSQPWMLRKWDGCSDLRAIGLSMLRRSEIMLQPVRLRQLKPNRQRPPFSNCRIRPREWPDDAKYCVAVLTGCVQDLIYPHVNRATADVLLANECEIVVPPRQFCCGSLHAHNGELDWARDLARRNIDMFDLDEVDAVITNSGGCGSHLKKYGELLHDDAAYRDRASLE
jgi:glycolate oxidase iron-sulfur subunit